VPAKKPAAPLTPPVTGPSAALVARAKREGLALVPPLKDAVEELTIETEDDYRQMDVYLSDIARARKTWTAKLAPIRDPLKEAVAAAKRAMTAADALFKEVDTPLAELEATARLRMKAYQTEKQRRISAAADEQRRIQEEIDRAAQVEAYGRTAAQRQKATATREALEEKQAEVFESAPVLAQADGSGSRVAKKIRASDPAKLLRFIADNYEELADCAEILQPALNRRFKDDPEGMGAWPGVEVYDDVTIVRKA
jgi:hypothetical protein